LLPTADQTVKKRPPGGSRLGKPNKLPAAIKEMVLEALDKAGGVDYLVEQSRENPVAFLGLVGKVLPHTLHAKVDAGLTIHWALPRTPLDG